MKSFEGFKSEPTQQSFPQLPAGAYVASIIGVREEGEFPDDSILLQLEVIEGEWAGYYTKRYHSDSARAAGGSFEPRYKGTFRIRAPRAENPHIRDLNWAVRSFNNSIWSIEDSNDGFHFDFDHVSALKGKTVGINVRNAQYNGADYTEIGRLESAKQVREGKVRPMKDRVEQPAAGYQSAAFPYGGSSSGPAPVDVEELPF